MKPKNTLRSFLVLAGSTLLAIPTIHAATVTWDHNADGTASDGNGTWLNANQWLDGAIPATWNNATPDNAIIGSGGTGGTITLGAVAAGTVSINNFSGTYTLNGTSLDQTGGITVGSTAGAVTINSIISGGGGLTMTGTGRLTLSNAANSYSGQLSIENGELFRQGSINNNSANGVFGNSALPLILGASGQTGRLSILNDGGLSTNKGFTLATGGTGEIRFGNLGTFNITNANRPLTLSGSIGGSGNFVKLGGATVILSGNNDYSGTTTVNEGQLQLNHATALPGGIGATGGTSALTIHGNGTINVGATIGLTATSGNFLRGLGTGVDQFQIPGGISGFDAFGSARQVIVNNDPAFELQWGIPTFNPSEFLFGFHPQTGTAALTLQNKIDLNGATRTVRVNSNTATLSNEIRTSSGTAGLIKNGAGTLVLSGANTYNGPTQINEGTLTISNAATFTNTSAINLALGARLEVSAANASLTKLVTGGGVPFGRFLRYSSAQTAAGPANGPGTVLGTVELNLTNVNPDYTLDFGSDSTFQNLVTATYTSPITLSGNASINSSAQVFTLNTGGITASTAGAKTLALTGSNTGANIINSVIGNGSGTIAVAKTGGGSWTLAGTNSYSGATTAGAGTLTLSGADGSIGSSAVTVAGGTLTVSNTGAANNGDRLSNSSAFTMNGGTFNFNNSTGAFDYSESAGTLTVIGGANTVAIQQAAVGQLSTLTFAGLSRTGGAINFTGAGLGAAMDPRSKITFTSAPTLADGIIGPWATVNGTDYAALIGNDVVAYGGAMTDLTRQSSGTKAIPDSATADVRIIEGTGGGAANITLAATTTTIDTILNSTSGGTGATTIAIASGETLRVNSINSVPTAAALTLGTSVNTGTLMPATVGGDLLLINNSTASNFANANNNMTVNSVVADNTSASSVTKDGAGVLRLVGTNTYSGGTVINAGTVALKADANLGAAGTGITFNGTAALSVGNHPATGSLSVTLGLRPITINNGAVAGLHHNWADTTITIGGNVTGDGGIRWGRDPVLDYNGGSGSVTLNLNGTGNNFTGPITVGMGNENAQGGASAFNFSSLADSINPITFNFNGGGVVFSHNVSGPTANLSVPSRPINLLNSNATIRNQNATYTMTLGAVSTSTAGAKTLNLGNAGAGGTIAGNISNGNGTIGVTKSGNGTWALSGTNSYSGVTSIGVDSGTLSIRGTQAMATGSKIVMNRNTTLQILTDDSGTVNLGNNIEFDRFDNSPGIIQNYTVNVGNNGGATTGSTIVLGNLDFTKNDMRPSRQLTTTGANGYSVRVGNVSLATEIQGTATGGAQRFTPSTAALTITGTVKQINGNTGTQANANSLYLGGAMTGNLVSGTIADADDFPSNPNAKRLNVYKGDSGSWTLSGTNTYTGTTTVTAGTLRVNSPGSLAPASAVSVTGTATLGGNGTIGGNVTVATTANLAPGASAGTLSIGGDLDISALAGGSGKLNFELGAIGSSDRIAVTGGLNIGSGTLGLSDFNLSNLGGLQNGTYTLLSSSGLTGSLDGGDVNDVDTIFPGATIQLQPSGNNIVLSVSGLGGGSPYQTWATGNEPFDGDANGDGVTDGLAFLLGAASPSENAAGRLPSVTESGGDLILTFNCLPVAARGTAVLKVAHSATLASWTATTNVVPDASGPDAGGVVSYVVGAGPVGPPALNTVTATIDSAAAGKLFGRLEATE